jgi:hypothetical protein
VRTTRAWCDALRKPLLCVIVTPNAIDAFDNSASRQLIQEQCRADQIPCLRVGLYADYCEVVWDERYRVPRDVGGNVCDYPLARNLVVMASEAAIRFVASGERKNWTGTLGDLAVVDFDG